jgi:hypothetical protein
MLDIYNNILDPLVESFSQITYLKNRRNYGNFEDDADEAPRYSINNNLIYTLSIQDIQGIVENAYEQKSNCDVKDLIEAFLYYFDNDAFIEFTD